MSQSVPPSDNPTATRVKIGQGSFGAVFRQGDDLLKISTSRKGNQDLRHQIRMYQLLNQRGLGQFIPDFIGSGQKDGLTYISENAIPTQYDGSLTIHSQSNSRECSVQRIILRNCQ